MENFEELTQAVRHKEKIEEYLKRIKTIGFIGQYGRKTSIGITDHYNDRYTFSGIAELIGEEKLVSIVKQFEGLINVELQNEKENAEKELSKFTIINQGSKDK